MKNGLSTTPGAATAAHIVPRLPSTRLRFMARRDCVGVRVSEAATVSPGQRCRAAPVAPGRLHRCRSAAADAIIGPSGTVTM